MNLALDPASHTYTLDGKELPGVTQVLSAEGFIDQAWFTEYGRDRGTKVHQTIEFYDADELDEDSLDAVLRPYLEAWRRFRAEAHVAVEASEVRLASEVYGFAGTIDKLATIGIVPAILDIKTGQVQPWAAIQLAAYHILLNQTARKRYAVQLNNDGSYRLQEFKDRNDRAVFLAALAVNKWKRRQA